MDAGVLADPNEPVSIPECEVQICVQPPTMPSIGPKPPAKRGRAAKPAFAIPRRVGTRAHPLDGPVSPPVGIPAHAIQPLLIPEVQQSSEDATLTRSLMEEYDSDSDDNVPPRKDPAFADSWDDYDKEPEDTGSQRRPIPNRPNLKPQIAKPSVALRAHVIPFRRQPTDVKDVMLNPLVFHQARKELRYKPSVDLFANADHSPTVSLL